MSKDSVATGVGILARNSVGSSRRHSQVSLLVENQLYDANNQAQNLDDRNWSWSYLRSRFKINDLSGLYDRYVQRLQNAYFVVFLLLQLSIGLSLIAILLLVNYDKDISVAIPEVTVHAILGVFCIVAFLLTNDETLFRNFAWAQVAISVLTVVIMMATDIGLSVYFYVYVETIRTPIAFQTLITIYYFLPLPKKYQSFCLGFIVSLCYLVFAGVFLYEKSEYRRSMVVADLMYYICGNVVGLYSQLLSEISIRRAFLDRLGYIKSTIKKKYEKDQEEQLLLSILPSHISAKVKMELLSAITSLRKDAEKKKGHHYPLLHNGLHIGEHRIFPHHNSISRKHKNQMQKKPFSELFVEKHNNVTILYADIVNFTPLTVKLKADELVDTLNELFGRFDEAAALFDCLRIKLLGDCYYCVSGLPTPTPSHAKNCVQLGFQMIEIIKDVREKLKVDVSMRIGIHSGNILSGLLGVYKWQYDIWSKDVTIANHMEQSGKAGRVHITQHTKDILGNAYGYEPYNAKYRDKYLAENDIDTFLVIPPTEPPILNIVHDDNGNEEDEEPETPTKTIFSKSNHNLRKQTSSVGKSADSLIRKKSLGRGRADAGAGVADVFNFRNLISQVNEKMAKAIDDMPLRKTDQWCGKKRGSFTLDETPILMTFNSIETEIQFQRQGDPLFKYYIGCALCVLLCIGIVQGLIMPSNHVVLWIAFGIGFSFLVLVFPFVWIGYIWSRMKDPHREMDTIPEPKSPLVKFFYNVSITVTNSVAIRTAIYLTVSLLISTFAIIDVIECDPVNYNGPANATTSPLGGVPETKRHEECEYPWYFTYSCALAFLLVNGFFRINYILKLLLCVVSLAMYSLTIFKFRAEVFDDHFGAGPALPAVYSHVIYLVKIVLYLHFMDRQMEYINRLDFIWKKKLTEEHNEAQLTHEINTILIQNILPLQIAKIYMDPNRSSEGHNRSYQNISVMFASIPNFMDFYAENDLNDHGIKCLQLLNEIIVEFDQALALVDFDEVEKIKVIGSTYMAACGLEVRETRSSTASVTSEYMSSMYHNSHAKDTVDYTKRRKNLMILVRFAVSMMIRLQGINKDAFQDFQLRVGVDCGPVVAGVIGVQKPFYDIWGDTVNMASRMDTTGKAGKIQLTEESAKLLMQSGIKCEPRGLTKVKGKGEVNCYFLCLGRNFEIQYEEPSTDEEILPLRRPALDFRTGSRM